MLHSGFQVAYEACCVPKYQTYSENAVLLDARPDQQASPVCRRETKSSSLGGRVGSTMYSSHAHAQGRGKLCWRPRTGSGVRFLDGRARARELQLEGGAVRRRRAARRSVQDWRSAVIYAVDTT
eukprot:5461474-Pleurochrysis_carterae.AAC.2